MKSPAFIGDEVTAAAFRLAGLTVHVPESGDTQATFRRALETSSLVLITVQAAGRVGPGAMDRAVRRAAPPVAVVESAVSEDAPPDLERFVRATLGVGS